MNPRNRWVQGLRQLREYPSAIAGAAIILLLVLLSIYTVIAIPYGEAMERWRGGSYWERNPVNAGPVWLDRLTGGNLPATFTVEPSRNAMLDPSTAATRTQRRRAGEASMRPA